MLSKRLPVPSALSTLLRTSPARPLTIVVPATYRRPPATTVTISDTIWLSVSEETKRPMAT